MAPYLQKKMQTENEIQNFIQVAISKYASYSYHWIFAYVIAYV